MWVIYHAVCTWIQKGLVKNMSVGHLDFGGRVIFLGGVDDAVSMCSGLEALKENIG